MEFQYSLMMVTFFLLLFFFWLLWQVKKHNFRIKANSLVPKLPPGPWKLPLIGNLHQLTRVGSLPHHALRELAQKYGPLMHLQLGEISAVIISSQDMAKEIMKTHDLCFLQRPKLLAAEILLRESADIVFAPYGEYWRQMRKICTLELLSAKRVQSFSSIREDEVAQFIESIRVSAGSSINLSARISSLISVFVARAAFGNKCKDQDEFLTLLREVLELSGGFDLADFFPSLKPIYLITGLMARLEKMQKRVDKILEDIIKANQEKQEKAKEGNENLLDVLLKIQRSPIFEIPVTSNNIKAVIWDIFGGGTDTSAIVVEWAVSELMRNPRVREKAQAEIRGVFRGKKIIHENDLEELSYLQLVIKETLRLHPPAPLLLPRECREPCNIGSYEIPIKTKVLVNAWALGRDPKHWNDAESFIPERFHGTSFDFQGNNFEYIPFGAGRRMCPGVSFAIASIELPLASLLYHFNWELPNGMKPEDLDMIEAFGGVVRRKNNLYLIPTPCNP